MLGRFVWITRIEKFTIQNELFREVLRFFAENVFGCIYGSIESGRENAEASNRKSASALLRGHPSTMCTFCEPTLDTVLWETIFWD